MSQAMEDAVLPASGLDTTTTNEDITATHALMIEADLIERFGTATMLELVLIRAAAAQAAEVAFAHMQITVNGPSDAAMGQYAVLMKDLGRTLWTLGSTEKLIGSAAFGTLEMAFQAVRERLEAAAPAGSA